MLMMSLENNSLRDLTDENIGAKYDYWRVFVAKMAQKYPSILTRDLTDIYRLRNS